MASATPSPAALPDEHERADRLGEEFLIQRRHKVPPEVPGSDYA